MTDQTRLALEFICQSEDFKSGYNQVIDYFMGCAERSGEAFDNLEASGFFKVPESEELLSSIPSVHFKKEFVYDVLDLYQSKIGIHIFDSLDNNKDAWDENEYPVFYKVRKDYCDDFDITKNEERETVNFEEMYEIIMTNCNGLGLRQEIKTTLRRMGDRFKNRSREFFRYFLN